MTEARKAAAFYFKQFSIRHDRSAMKVGTDGTILGALVDCHAVNRILDIGAGTGVVSLMMAQRSKAAITAVELDELSFLDLQENCQMSKFSDQIKLEHCRIQDFKSAERFDLIVSNPPYFSKALISPSLPRRRARHDVDLSAEDLLTAILKLLSVAGCFYLILPTDAMATFKKRAIEKGLFLQKSFGICHTKILPAVREIAVFTFKLENSPTYSNIVLRNENGSFSEDYIRLMKDYLIVL